VTGTTAILLYHNTWLFSSKSWHCK
jgi:hypothetical protein